jgi:hypothetical protein
MDTVCDRVLAQDRRIGFAMVVDDQGQIAESKMRGTPLMPREDIAALAGVWTNIMGGIAQQLEKYFGRSEGLSLRYEKVNVHGFAAGDKTVVITARKDLPLEIVLSLKEIAES